MTTLTVDRAAVDSLGVRDERGREIRTVQVDPERAELVTWAFQVFASGQWTTTQLHRELVRRGLTTPPSPSRPSKPIGLSSVHRILTNPYYKGDIRYKGATFKGTHEAIVPREVWYQVQSVLDAHKSAADATQIHDHYLKGTVYCGQCGSRLIICQTRNRHGSIYPYFVCSGRHGGSGDCTRQAVLIEDVERLIEGYYDRIQISGETRQSVAGMMHAQFDQLMAADTQELSRLASDRDRLDDERTKLLQAHYAGAVPLDLLKKEQARIGAELENTLPRGRTWRTRSVCWRTSLASIAAVTMRTVGFATRRSSPRSTLMTTANRASPISSPTTRCAIPRSRRTP